MGVERRSNRNQIAVVTTALIHVVTLISYVEILIPLKFNASTTETMICPPLYSMWCLAIRHVFKSIQNFDCDKRLLLSYSADGVTNAERVRLRVERVRPPGALHARHRADPASDAAGRQRRPSTVQSKLRAARRRRLCRPAEPRRRTAVDISQISTRSRLQQG